MSILLIQLATFVQHQRNARRHICVLFIAYSEHVIASLKSNEEDRNIFKQTLRCYRADNTYYDDQPYHYIILFKHYPTQVFITQKLFDLKKCFTQQFIVVQNRKNVIFSMETLCFKKIAFQQTFFLTQRSKMRSCWFMPSDTTFTCRRG